MMQQDKALLEVHIKNNYDAEKKLSVAYWRKRLGKAVDGKTDEEIIVMRNIAYQLANALYSTHKSISYNNYNENIQQ